MTTSLVSRIESSRYSFSSLVGLGHVIILVLFACAMLSFGWTGFISSDDAYYVRSAEGWLHDFPYVGKHFGTARAPVGIPMAISMLIFGENEFAAVASTCFFLLATLLVTYYALATRFGASFALATAIVLASIPLFVLKATIPSADLPLLFFCVASFWLFVGACEGKQRGIKLLLSGMMAGLAIMSHETAAALLMIYGVLFLIGYAIPRRDYFIMAVGFAVPLLIELLYYGILTGDPLHRFNLSMVGVAVADRVPVAPFQFDDSGNLHIARFIDPLVMLLTKQEFCLLYYFVIPAAFWAWKPLRIERRPDGGEKTLAWLFALAGVIWFLFSAIALIKLKLLPRYYMVPTYFFAVAAALWFRTELLPKRRIWAVAILILAVSVNLLGIAVDNKNPISGERALVEYLGVSSGTVSVDPYTAWRSRVLCNWSQQDCTRIQAGTPRPGGLFFYNPKNALGPNRFIKTPEDAALYTPRPGWELVWSKPGATKLFTNWPAIQILKGMIPAPIFAKLTVADASLKVYRIPEE